MPRYERKSPESKRPLHGGFSVVEGRTKGGATTEGPGGAQCQNRLREIPTRVGDWLEGIVEVFNLFNITNVLGVSNVNYSGFANALVRDSSNPASPGFLRSSSFGQAVTTAGGVFGSGGPRAFQFAVRFSF